MEELTAFGEILI